MNESKTPDEWFDTLAERLRHVEAESIELPDATGRILATPVIADRDSPAADVSAMDGYAIRSEDCQPGASITVQGESAPGHQPPAPPADSAMRVFTGGIVPQQYDLVVKREDTEEGDAQIRLLDAASAYRDGENIRRRGENSPAGSEILQSGLILTPASIAAAANFGATCVNVSRQLRVAIVVTGDELKAVEADVQPWQLRDSNGPTIAALLGSQRWLSVQRVQGVRDDPESLQMQLSETLGWANAIVMTGGVSMGDHDYVPDAIRAVGAQVVFHRLPIRPGKPILGAVTSDGQPIFGLPGNPVSSAVGARRFVMRVLRKQARASKVEQAAKVQLVDSGDRSIPLHWFRLVEIQSDGSARIVPSKGSGDLVSMAQSDGFVEQAPNQSGPGPWPYWSWI